MAELEHVRVPLAERARVDDGTIIGTIVATNQWEKSWN